MKKVTDIILYVTIFYGVVIMFFLIAASLGYLPPVPLVNINDFVVDSKGNIVAVSSFQRRVFFVSKEGTVIDSVKIPESKGDTLMAIDSSDNIYINRLRSVEVLSLNKKPKVYSVAPDKTDDWILDGNEITNLNRSVTSDYTHCTDRHRRVINPGEALFFDTKCGSAITAGAYDDFHADQKVYRCNSFLKNAVSVYDSQGRLLYTISIIPWYLTILAFPFPSIYILAVIGLACWILKRILAAPSRSKPIPDSSGK